MTIYVEFGEILDVTGHYPVLAGFDPTGEPLYIALKDRHFYGILTCVKNGSSHATFVIDHVSGETVTVDRFYVLVLRHDPVDSKPTAVPDGAMDPTGPVFWLNYWPERDPSLPDDPSFMELDRRLKFAFKGGVGSGREVRGDES